MEEARTIQMHQETQRKKIIPHPTKDEDQMHSSTFKTDNQQHLQHTGDSHAWRYTRSDALKGFQT